MSFTSFMYAMLRFNRDMNAIKRGPRAMAKRQARKAGYKAASKIINRVTR